MKQDTSSAGQKLNRLRQAAIVMLWLVAVPGRAQEVSWHVLVEPGFMRPPVSKAIPGSKRTVLAYALRRGGEIGYAAKEDLARLKIDLDVVDRLAAQNASAELARLDPHLVRGKDRVIEYAVLDSESPLTASTVLAPDFEEKFAETLGPDLLVAIPHRYRVYVFSRAAARLELVAPLVLRDFETAIYPVSTEVFTVKTGRLRAFGEYASSTAHPR